MLTKGLGALYLHHLNKCLAVAGKTDSHRSKEEGTTRNAKPGEFAEADPKKPKENTPEAAREKSGQ